MATPGQMAKKAANQTTSILAAVEGLAAEVAKLIAALPAPIELSAEVFETADRTGEILAAIGNAFGEISSQLDRTLSASAMTVTEIAQLRAEVAELKSLMTPAQGSQMPTRKPKK